VVKKKKIEDFTKHNECKNGRCGTCKQCSANRVSKIYHENIINSDYREICNEYKREYYGKNKKKCNSINSEWKKNNPDKVNANSSKWKKNNRDKNNSINYKWKKNNPDKNNSINYKWKKNNPDKAKKHTISWNFKSRYGFKLPEEIIETKLIIIKTKILCKTLKTYETT